MSTQVCFKPGITWDTIPTTTARRLVDAAQLQEYLDGLRQEWTTAEEVPAEVRATVDAVLAEVQTMAGV